MFAYAMANKGSAVKQFKRQQQFIPSAPQQQPDPNATNPSAGGVPVQ
jgi:hypothetical protein